MHFLADGLGRDELVGEQAEQSCSYHAPDDASDDNSDLLTSCWSRR